MIENELRKRVQESTYYTKKNILEQQQSHCPVSNAFKFKHTWSLMYEGYEHHLVFDDVHFYKTMDMRYTWFKDTKPKFKSENMYNLVSKNIIFPVLFFVNGRFQKWSNITIIPEQNNTTYVVITDIIEPRRSLNTVYIPLNKVLYMENPSEYEVKLIKSQSNHILCFDSSGYFVPEDSDKTVDVVIGFCESQDISIDTSTNIDYTGTPYYTVDRNILVNEYIGTPANIAFDKNGKFIENFENDLEYIGEGVYKISNVNPNSIGNIYTFVWKGGNSFKTDMAYRLDSDNSTEVKTYKETTSNNIKYFDITKNGKQLDWFSQGIEDNIKDSLISILEYDQSIIKDAYLDKCKIFTRETTVGDMLDRRTNGNLAYCTIPRRFKGLMNNSLIVFVDGELHNNQISINSNKDVFGIPLMSYCENRNADVELMYFIDVQNSVYDVTIESKDKPIYIPTDINPEYLQLFYHLDENYKDNFSLVYEIKPNDFTYFPIKFTLEHVESNMYKVKLENESLYGKKFKMVSRRQFRHSSVVWSYASSDYRVYLGEKFNYASDDDGFLVFINGRKLNRENFLVTLPGDTRPFNRPVLEITTFLDEGDKIDIFYLPQSIKTVTLGDAKDYQPLAFLMDQDDKFIYNLSKDLQFFFVNGKKISKKYIEDVSAEHVVITKATSRYNLNILYHIEGFELINELYKKITKPEYIRKVMIDVIRANSSTEVTDEYLEEQLGKIMTKGKELDIRNIEENIQKYHADIKALINNIVMEYYADYGLETNKPFVHDIGNEFLDKFPDEKPINGEDVYCLDIFNAEGLLKYDIRNDHIDDQTVTKIE